MELCNNNVYLGLFSTLFHKKPAGLPYRYRQSGSINLSSSGVLFLDKRNDEFLRVFGGNVNRDLIFTCQPAYGGRNFLVL